MASSHTNAQREISLLAEWITTLPRHYRVKTHVRVGAAKLLYQGQVLTPARQRAFDVWNSWADARVFTGQEVWVVEAKIVGTGGAYGQVYDYLDSYPQSLDARQFPRAPVRGFVLCAFVEPRLMALFTRWNIATIIFTPSWAGDSLANKVHHEVMDA